MTDYKTLCEGVKTLVLKAATYIAKEALDFNASKIETKGKHDLVSYVDRGAEEILVAGLVALLPEAGFITEEKTITKDGPEFTWIIDPLDGTTNFMHGLPVYSVSVALQRHDTLKLGVVYEISRKELFYAWEGSPAYLNGTEIRVSGESSMDDSLVATGFPYNDFSYLEGYMSLLKEVITSTRGLRRLGSAAVDMAYVACGRYEAYFEYTINSYDIAGGMFVLQQAGGKVSTFEGDERFGQIFTRRNVLASNGHLHPRMLQLIATSFKL